MLNCSKYYTQPIMNNFIPPPKLQTTINLPKQIIKKDKKVCKEWSISSKNDKIPSTNINPNKKMNRFTCFNILTQNLN